MQSKGLSRVFSNTTAQKHLAAETKLEHVMGLSVGVSPGDESGGMATGKTIALTRWTFVGKVMSLLLNMLSRLVITYKGSPGWIPGQGTRAHTL